jgi:hypothetical protein
VAGLRMVEPHGWRGAWMAGRLGRRLTALSRLCGHHAPPCDHADSAFRPFRPLQCGDGSDVPGDE